MPQKILPPRKEQEMNIGFKNNCRVCFTKTSATKFEMNTHQPNACTSAICNIRVAVWENFFGPSCKI